VSQVKSVVSGIGMGESARWHDGSFWFADWIAGTISKLEASGQPRIVARVSSFPVSFDWLPDGRMLVVSGAEGSLSVLEDGELHPYCDLHSVNPFSWNEIVVDEAGNAYVNNIGYAFPGEPKVAGVVAVVTPDRRVHQLAADLAFPNGMALTPDGRTLIVAESHAGQLTAFTVMSDGSLGERRVWAAVADSAPDGIAWGHGGIWFADVPNQHCVLVAEGGAVLRTAEFGAACFSCATDGATLLAMTAPWPLDFSPTAARSGEARTMDV
jgi:sugar lactone lactonase YvrE